MTYTYFDLNTAAIVLTSLVYGSIFLQCFRADELSKAWGFATFSTLLNFIFLFGATLLSFETSGVSDLVSLVFATLVGLLGAVITSYSKNYLDGEPRQKRFIYSLIATLFSVNLLVLSNHLGIICISWIAASFGLHYLLTFYNNRIGAARAAHKKFIFSRLGDAAFFIGVMLIYGEVGSFFIDDLNLFLAQRVSIPISLYLATAFIALSVVFKSAQIPFHGWLLQVMEAPTPVSALLHAGVVNIGGFLLIKLALLFSFSLAAQAILVVFGLSSAFFAGMSMLTSTSIKERLAWSTCSQIGFMVLECGLGLYEMAFLHLIAHSVFKAYKFLSCGSTVYEVRRSNLIGRSPTENSYANLMIKLSSFLVTILIVVSSLKLWSILSPDFHMSGAAVAVICFGLSALLWKSKGAAVLTVARNVIIIFLVTQIYFFWHIISSAVIPHQVVVQDYTILAAITVVAFTLMYFTQSWITVFPNNPKSIKIIKLASKGFYLDEFVSTFLFRVVPLRAEKTRKFSAYSETRNYCTTEN